MHLFGVCKHLWLKRAASTDEMLDTAIQTGMDAGLIGLGDTVVITAGVPVAETGTTNLMKSTLLVKKLLKDKESVVKLQKVK